MTAAVANFTSKAPSMMDRLIKDFSLSAEQAAGILGNLGHESLGLTVMQELHPVSGRGGYGYAQWTGSRRVAYEAFCKKNNYDPASDQANYAYLRLELSTAPYSHAIQQIKKTTSLDAATDTFEMLFEKAGVPAFASRRKWAALALAAWQAAKTTAPPPTPPPAPVPVLSQLDRIEAALARVEALLARPATTA